MPEIGLGLGRAMQVVGGISLEVLLWHDQADRPFQVPEEELRQLQVQVKSLEQRAEAERQRAEAERKERMRLIEYVRSLGIDPDNLPPNNLLNE